MTKITAKVNKYLFFKLYLRRAKDFRGKFVVLNNSNNYCYSFVRLLSSLSFAMPKDSYFTAVAFSFSFFFRRLIFEVTERISTKLGHMFTDDCCLITGSAVATALC